MEHQAAEAAGEPAGVPRGQTGAHLLDQMCIRDRLTVEQLEYAMMVESANDAANGLAVHLAGSLEAFALRMNSRAAELGL